MDSSSSVAPTPAAAATSSCGPTSKKRSLVWVHFGRVDDKTAQCDLCAEKIKTSGNTTNLMTVSCPVHLNENTYIHNYIYIYYIAFEKVPCP